MSSRTVLRCFPKPDPAVLGKSLTVILSRVLDFNCEGDKDDNTQPKRNKDSWKQNKESCKQDKDNWKQNKDSFKQNKLNRGIGQKQQRRKIATCL